MWNLQFSATIRTRLPKLGVGSMRLIRLASFDSFDPVGERFEVHIEGTKNGGMTSQTRTVHRPGSQGVVPWPADAVSPYLTIELRTTAVARVNDRSPAFAPFILSTYAVMFTVVSSSTFLTEKRFAGQWRNMVWISDEFLIGVG
jgi:hypothetical protein